MKLISIFATLCFCVVYSSHIADAEVKQSSPTGFSIQVSRTVDIPASEAYRLMIEDFSKWYNADHSYSAKAENLSLDLKQHCMLEKLPDGGFVRHMEIVFHQPGKVFRMTGGLGPLQGMGVSGALTFSFKAEGNKTEISMSYNVSGADFLNLDKIAGPVDQVLVDQMDRLKKHCNTLALKAAATHSK